MTAKCDPDGDSGDQSNRPVFIQWPSLFILQSGVAVLLSTDQC